MPEQTLIGWMFEHPWMTLFLVGALIEGLTVPLRYWARGRDREWHVERVPTSHNDRQRPR